MKINRIPKDNDKKNSKKGSFLMNLYYLFAFYRYVVFLIIGLGLSVFLILLVADFVDPKTLGSLDKKATLKLFNQLQEANRYQEAIILMETKANTINDTPLELEFKTKLSDSYIHVGDYSKAEKMLLDVWNKTPRYIAEYEREEGKGFDKDIANFLKYGIARMIYQFYEKIGDKTNQVKFFNIYKSYYDLCGSKIDTLTTNIYNSKTWFAKMTIQNSKELVEYDSIVVSYEINKNAAISGMRNFINKIINRKEYGPSFKVKCLNKLIKWELENGKLIDSYSHIALAVKQVRQMNMPNEYARLGELSDYCYAVHDIELSKSLFRRYEDYLEKNYSKNDLEYLSNSIRKFRYLEADGKLDKLVSELNSYCVGMRRQIAINMPSMSEEQREFFAKQFDYGFYYAFNMLQKHPSEKLAALCFDNITFRSGLLLRSNQSLRHSIENLNDPEAINLYNELNYCRRELIFENVSGKKFFNNKKELTTRINDIEKTLALKSTDFKTKNQIVECTYKDIRNKLRRTEALVDFVEYDGNLFALILRDRGDVKYVPIGKLSDISGKLKGSISAIYHNSELTNFLWSKVDDIVKDCSTIYYMSIGVFNQIALENLYVGNNSYLCDSKDWKLLSNQSQLLNGMQSVILTHQQHNISLWGGIDYGDISSSNNIDYSASRKAIKRGESLRNLTYTYQEVMNISDMLKANHIKNMTFTKNVATESSFKNRSGKKDYIIHISTHGFFDDKTNSNNSMLQSGLFFAGANKYWTNDTINVASNQEDGILRAAEISILNLSGCSLAVLSACETGLGFCNSSEGVYGLQRAFKLAGADMVLMSLWDVDDRATNLLMTEFYHQLLLGKDVDFALKESKRRVRKDYPSPEDWGGFVLLH